MTLINHFDIYEYSPFTPFPAIMLLMALSLFVTSVAAKPTAQPPIEQYLKSVLDGCDRIEKQIPELTKLAEIVAMHAQWQKTFVANTDLPANEAPTDLRRYILLVIPK